MQLFPVWIKSWHLFHNWEIIPYLIDQGLFHSTFVRMKLFPVWLKLMTLFPNQSRNYSLHLIFKEKFHSRFVSIHYCNKIFINLIQFLKWLIPPHIGIAIGLFETILQIAVSSLCYLYVYTRADLGGGGGGTGGRSPPPFFWNNNAHTNFILSIGLAPAQVAKKVY